MTHRTRTGVAAGASGILLAAVTAAATAAPEKPDGARSAGRDAGPAAVCPGTEDPGIEGPWRDWRDALRRADTGAVAALVTKDAELWIQATEPLIGREALLGEFAPFFGGYEMGQEFQCQELIPRGDWAFARGMEVNRLRARRREGDDRQAARLLRDAPRRGRAPALRRRDDPPSARGGEAVVEADGDPE